MEDQEKEELSSKGLHNIDLSDSAKRELRKLWLFSSHRHGWWNSEERNSAGKVAINWLRVNLGWTWKFVTAGARRFCCYPPRRLFGANNLNILNTSLITLGKQWYVVVAWVCLRWIHRPIKDFLVPCSSIHFHPPATPYVSTNISVLPFRISLSKQRSGFWWA